MLVKFEQNHMVQTRNFELFDWKKKMFFKTTFDKTLMPFWKTFLSLKQLFDAKVINLKTTIFQFSKNYGSPTRVTR